MKNTIALHAILSAAALVISGCGGSTNTASQSTSDGGASGASGSAGVGGAGTAGSAAGSNAGSGGSGGTGANAGSSGVAGSAGTEIGGPLHCENRTSCPGDVKGSSMVLVPCASGGAFCIDSYEATRADYDAFLAASPATSGQGAGCSWNTTFAPDETCENSEYVTKDPAHPQVCVDWCDAAAFCAWEGKRLCQGDWSHPADTAYDEWFTACSAGGTKDFPYGTEYDPAVCNDYAAGADALTTDAVGANANCIGGYPGLYDMAGNVYEWVNTTTGGTPGSANCVELSSFFGSTGSDRRCESGATRACNEPDWSLGIRCCL